MIIPVILSGGSGTRLWPLSRESRPKQFLPLTDDKTMLQLTALRVNGAEGFASPTIVASRDHADEIERQLGQVGISADTLVLEPVARNTAPAIALAALLAPTDSLMLVMPSDHLIRDTAAFLDAVRDASGAAEDGWLVTFGVEPDRPETGYGYIRHGETGSGRVRRAERFIEKPDAATAAALVLEGRNCWNSGIFLFRPEAYLGALEAHAPEVLRAARAAISRRDGDARRITPDREAFASSPSISIDYAVMERAERVAVVPVTMGWSDIGSWDALHELGEKAQRGNVLSGDALAIDSSNCHIRSDGPAVIAVGVDDLIVIASGDAVLVVPRGQSQRVKEAVAALAARGRGDAVTKGFDASLKDAWSQRP